ERATRATPMLPPAPVMFSTITGRPNDTLMRSASSRASASVEAPGATGTTRVTGCVRVGCATAPAHWAAATAAARSHFRIWHLWSWPRRRCRGKVFVRSVVKILYQRRVKTSMSQTTRARRDNAGTTRLPLVGALLRLAYQVTRERQVKLLRER